MHMYIHTSETMYTYILYIHTPETITDVQEFIVSNVRMCSGLNFLNAPWFRV
jgi:hypothetical protein